MQGDYDAEITAILLAWCEESVTTEPLRAACRYMLSPGGKYSRPHFALALCEDLGGDPASILTFVAAIELLHVASLVHDDLPAIDDDEMRRGRPSCHRQFGEATAILCADTMISGAFSLVAQSSQVPRQALFVVRVLSKAFSDLCDGQQLDLVGANSQEELLLLHQLKTGALFRAAALVSASNWSEDEYLTQQLDVFGLWVGVAFQIVDDLIDGTAEKGKGAASDKANRKETFQSLTLSALLSGIEVTRERTLASLEALSLVSNCSFARSRSYLGNLFARLDAASVKLEHCGNG